MRYRNIGFATTGSYSGTYTVPELDFRKRTAGWPTNTIAVSDTSLVLYLDANNYSSGTTWSDQSGTGNDMIFNSAPSTGTDSTGKYISIDGTHYAATANAIIGTADRSLFTYIAVVQPTTLNIPSYNTVMGTMATSYTQMGFYVDSGNNKNYMMGRNAGAGILITNLGVNTVVLNAWVMIGITGDGSTSFTMYVNGALLSTQVCITTAQTNGRTTIGSYNNAGSEPFRGNIAWAKVYNRTLSATEMTNEYNNVKSRFGI